MGFLPGNDLRVRLTLVVVLAFLPVISLTVFSVSGLRSDALQSARNETTSLFRTAASRHAEFNASGQLFLSSLAGLPEINLGASAECSAFLSQLLELHPVYSNLRVISPNGDLRCGAISTGESGSGEDLELLQPALEKRSFVSGGYFSDGATGDITLPMAYPVLNENREVDYVLMADMKAAWWGQLEENHLIPKGAHVLLVTPSGQLLASFPGSVEVAADPSLLQSMQVNQMGTLEVRGLDGVDRFYEYTPLDPRFSSGSTFQIAVGLPSELIFAEANRFQTNYLLGLGVILVVSVLAAYLAAKYLILNPIQSFIQVSQKIEQGDLSARSGGAHPIEEFSQLARVVDQMAISLDQREAALKESVQLLRSVIATMAEAILLQSRDGRILLANTSAEKLFRLTSDGLGKSHPEHPGWNVQQEDGSPLPRDSHPTRITLQTGKPQSDVVLGIQTDDGQVTWAMVNSQPIFLLNDNLPYAVVTTYHDITERNQNREILRRRAEELNALQATVLEITAPHDLESVLNTIVERAVQLLDADGGGLYICHPLQQEVRVVANYNTPHDYTGSVLKYGEGAAGQVALTGEALVIEDYHTWPGRTSLYNENFLFRGLITVPMRWQGQLIGMIQAIRYKEAKPFTQDDLSLLSMLANHAAIAVENTRLVEELKSELNERKKAEKAIQRRDMILSVTTFAAEKFLKTADWRETIQNVLAQLGQGTEVSRVYMFEIHTGSDGTLLTSQRYEWVNEGIDPQQDNPELQNIPMHESGFTRWVEAMQRGETIYGLIKDFPEAEREFLTAQNILSILVEPIYVDTRLWGFMGFDACQTAREWLPPEVDALKMAADTLGAAIQSELAEQALNRRATELQTLYQTSLEVNAQANLDALLRAIVQRAASLVQVDVGGMYLMEPDYASLKLVVGHNLPPQSIGTTIRLGEGLSGKVAQEGKALVVEDYLSWEERLKGFDTAMLRRILGVPLRAKDRVVGVINVSDRSRPGSFSEDEIRLVSLFADQAALAVENARLYEDAQRRLRRTMVMHEIDQAIAESLQLKLILDIVLQHTIHELGVDAAVILLFNPESQTLQYETGSGFRTDALQFTHGLRLGEGYAGKAALEKRTIQISNLHNRATDFLRSPTFSQEGFVCYLGVPLVTKNEIKGVLEIFHRSALNPDREWLGFMETLAGQIAIAIENATLYRELQRSNIDLTMAYDATIEGWSRALDLRDKETEGHTLRVTDLTIRIAREMGLNEEKLVHIRRGALLHDIGKMGIPDRILLKPDKLTGEEWELMRRHPEFAYEMLRPIAYLEPALEIPYYHHEKWDGSGYPQGLSGDKIPLAARIFAVIDVYDALTSDRPYRPAWSRERTLEYIQEQAGSHFDPEVVEEFLKHFGDFLTGKK